MSANSMMLKAPGLRGFAPNTLAAIDQYQGLAGSGTPEHMAVSAGRYFGTGSYNEALADDASIDILVDTGSASILEVISMGVVINTGADALFEVYRSPIVTGAGSVLPMLNVNESSDNTPESVPTLDPTMSSPGTLIFRSFIPGGSGGNAIGGSNTPFQRLLGSPDTGYLLRSINIGGQAKPMSFSATMIEVPKI